jgi:TadE-like protein
MISVIFAKATVRVSESCLGQGVVEFTLMFLLFLVIAWIPADFGLAMYSGQLALNASREGARIAAADPTLTTGTTTCTLPGCYSLADGTILKETAKRISSALMPGAQISLTYPVPGGVPCNRQLQVTVTGNYNYFFYRLLSFFGVSVPADVRIIRSTQMRWEHQNTCA